MEEDVSPVEILRQRVSCVFKLCPSGSDQMGGEECDGDKRTRRAVDDPP